MREDVNYFATMMVEAGDADGMVSGASHTTAATIRPALQLIKTRPGTRIASSVFFMLLRVCGGPRTQQCKMIRFRVPNTNPYALI